ncbi:MAG: tetratricopeptide repeat protein [Candidatus Taylorbacteria bacterium]|nr:tetratricopeptide repeat protein [Candidatus Taylorbacteria bacterium]
MDLNFWKKDNGDSHKEVENSKGEYQYTADAVGVPEASEIVNSPEYYQPEPPDMEKARFYGNISRWVLYIGIFLLPLFFLPWTTGVLELNKQLLLIIVAGAGMVAWLLGVVSSGSLAWRKNYLDYGILAFLGAFIVSTVFSMAKFKSLFGLSTSLSNSLTSIIALTLLYFLVVNSFEDRGRTLKSILGFSLVLVLAYGLLQIFGVYIVRLPVSMSRAFNTVGSVNVLGLIAAVGLPLFSKSRFDLKWLKNIHLEKIGVVIALVMLVVLNWWVLWTVAIAGMVAMIVFENLSGGRFRIKKLILPMTVVVLGVFLMVVNLNMDAFKKNLPVEVAPSFRLSKDVTASVLKEKLVFGYGLENFSVAFDKYGAGRLANTSLSNARFVDSTSEVLSLTVHGGVVMLVALGFMLWCLGVVLWRFRKYAAENHDQSSVKEDVGTLASTVALAVAFFLYPFNLTLMAMFYVFMGLVVLVIFDKNRREFNIEERTSLSLSSSLGFIGGLILVLVGVYFGMTTYLSDVKYAQALANKDNSQAAELLVEAINWNNQDDRYYRSASQVALGLLTEELGKPASAERNARIQNYVTTSISLARRATDLDPREALNWANLGFIYQNLLALVDGVDKLSEEAYLRASELRPGDPLFSFRIGMLYLGKLDILAQLVASRRITSAQATPVAQEAVKKAEDYLKMAVEKAPNFGLAIYNLGVIYDRQGKTSAAIRELEKVAPSNNNQPGLAFELGLLYYRVGRKDEAFNALERAVVLAPDYSNARWFLALIYEERGNIDGAIAQLERILNVEVNKDNPVVMTKLDELRIGKTRIPPGDVLDQEPLQ